MKNMAARPKITLYVDTVSPFAYEAYWIFRHDSTFSKCNIEYVPVFLGGIMKDVGNNPPINIKNKDKWIDRERLHWASVFNIPMSSETPVGFPHMTLRIQRALGVLPFLFPEENEAQDVLCQCLDRLYEMYWVEGKNISGPGVLEEVLKDVIGEEKKELVLKEVAGKGKEAVVKNNERAIREGAFGLPWMVCTNSAGETAGFWGVDHLAQVVDFLGLERTKNRAWKALL
ncbi:putative glutathione s-transferase kappa [Botrytis fragariae]|uniref:Glutathione S-transferase kappa n=1 Tax=Botrytis fragariae TaxID=1964551 RepID=A0A8H6AN07_9HELO|nr:putative glutathione s-transferase kappa [Botrytis fragariae]KAF5870399.1 putative glutathione s-transferase kappa [Botrytis fragariae]